MRYELIEICTETGDTAVVATDMTHGDAVHAALVYQAQSGMFGVTYKVRRCS